MLKEPCTLRKRELAHSLVVLAFQAPVCCKEVAKAIFRQAPLTPNALGLSFLDEPLLATVLDSWFFKRSTLRSRTGEFLEKIVCEIADLLAFSATAVNLARPSER